MFETYLKWIESHERLLLVAVAGVVLWLGIGRVDSLIARHDNANLQQAQVVAQAQADKTAAIAAQVAEQAAQYQALAAKVQQQNDALMQANIALSTALAKQQRTDASLPPTELVARLNSLVPKASASITNGQTTMPQSGTVAVVQELEGVPVLRTQLGNERTQLENAQSLVVAEGQQVATLNTEIGSLRLQITADAKACNEQIATVKDMARKSKRRWFWLGYAAGFISRQVIKTYTGV